MNEADPPRGGIAGLVLLFCATAVVAGLAFDFLSGQSGGFWLGARPGGAAAIGGAVAIFCIGAALIARLALGRDDTKGSDDADPHA